MHEHVYLQLTGVVWAVAAVVTALTVFYRRKQRRITARTQPVIDETAILAAAATADWTDRRPIALMPFGMNEKTPEAREATAASVRRRLGAYGCGIAHDITQLGCTGIAAILRGKMVMRTDAAMQAIEDGQFLRLGLAGGGVGLPCFVPPSRYCLVHQTIGGLQEGQAALHAEFVPDVSRELTPEETARVVVVERARRVQPGSASPETTQHAADLLAGRKQAEVISAFRDFTRGPQEDQIIDLDADDDDDEPDTDLNKYKLGAPTEWVCIEHKETSWACRYCVAQLVVEGELQPEFVVDAEGEALRAAPLDPAALQHRLQQLEKRPDTGAVAVYARVAVAPQPFITKGPTS